MANFFAFALGIATARAEDRTSDDQIRRGVLMGFAPSPIAGAVMSRVIEDREETPAPAVLTTRIAASSGGTGTPPGSATPDDIRRVEGEIADVKNDVADLTSTVTKGFTELTDLIRKSGSAPSGSSGPT